MSTFTNSITNIVNSGYVNPLTSSRQTSALVEAIKNSAIDPVTFSQESQNLFQISQIDTMLNGIFGLPNELNEEQKNLLETLRAGLDGFYPTGASQLEVTDINEILQNLGITEGSQKQIEGLTNELSSYLAESAIGQLFGTENSSNFSFYSNGYSSILGEKLTDDESIQLGNLSLQLNRLLYSSDDNQVSSYLNLFNDLYGLGTPSEEDLFTANALVTQRNTLLSSALLDRAYQPAYEA